MKNELSEEGIRARQLFANLAGIVFRMRLHASELDRESRFPTEELDQLRKIGALSAVAPTRFGGLGFGTEDKGALGLFNLLRLIGGGNLAVGRLFEGHVNAVVLVALYGSEKQIAKASEDARAGHLFAVWVTDPPEGLRISDATLIGSKVFCSGAGYATRALVTAKAENDESRMLLLSLEPGERTESLNLHPQGMRAATTMRIVLDGYQLTEDAYVGKAGDYLKDPAFSCGAWRTSAVTLGGLETLIDQARMQLIERGRSRNLHQQVRMGRAIIAQETARMWCQRAALIAEASRASSEEKVAQVNLARIAIEAATMDAIRLVQRSLGLAAFLEPNPVERLTRDLGTYLRQPAPDEALTEAASWFIKSGSYSAWTES